MRNLSGPVTRTLYKHILLRQFVHVTSVPDRTHSYLILIFSRQEKIAFHRSKRPSFCNESESKNSARPQQFHATRRKLRCVHGGACVEATKIDLFGCSIQSQTYGNRSLESYSLISFFEVANHPLNCRGIFLPVYSRAKKRCNC